MLPIDELHVTKGAYHSPLTEAAIINSCYLNSKSQSDKIIFLLLIKGKAVKDDKIW